MEGIVYGEPAALEPRLEGLDLGIEEGVAHAIAQLRDARPLTVNALRDGIPAQVGPAPGKLNTYQSPPHEP